MATKIAAKHTKITDAIIPGCSPKAASLGDK